MLDFSSAAKVWPTKPTKVSANQSVSRGVSACIWWVNAGYIQMMLDCFASSWARFKLSCVFVFFVFLLEPAATKAMTSLRMRELHFFLTQSSCQSERSLIHVIILSCLTRSSAKKKKEILQKNKNILCEAFIIQSLFISPNLQTFTFSSFFFSNISTHCPQCWERESLWADVNIFVNFWIKWINWMCERACVCVCAWFIYTVFMSTLYSEALNHEWTVVCDRVWDVYKEVVCSSSVFKKGRSRKRAGVKNWGLLCPSARIICRHL